MNIIIMNPEYQEPVSLIPAYNAEALTLKYCKELLKGSVDVLPSIERGQVLLYNQHARNLGYEHCVLADKYSKDQLFGPVIKMPLSVFETIA